MNHSTVMKNVCIVLFIGILLSSVTCKDSSIEEVEPNDSLSTATEIEPNARVKGFISTRNDRDYYRIEIIESSILDVLLSPVKGVNHSLKIWSTKGGKGVLIKEIDDLRKSSPERMCNVYCERGIYFISVQHGVRDIPKPNRETPYFLTLKSREPRKNEEREVNDSPELSNTITFHTKTYGYFSPSYNRLSEDRESPLREDDWFSLDIDLAQSNRIIIDIDVSGVPGVNAMLYLYSQERELISESDINGINEGESLKGIGVADPGRYYIVVTSRNFNSNHDVPYELTVTQREYEPTLEMEPNDVFEKANVITENYIRGSIFTSDDVDFFIYRVRGDYALHRIEIEPPPDVNIMFTVYDADRKKLFEVDNGSSGQKEILPDASISGDFYVKISTADRGFDKQYMYLLSITSQHVTEGFEREPNDSKKSATRITVPTIFGYTSRRGDVDYYALSYGKRVRCTFTVMGIAGGELSVSVTDPLGYILKTISVVGKQRKLFSEMIDEKGFIIVESVTENYDEPYHITIERNP